MTIYFDANATMPIKPSVIAKVTEVMEEVGNGSSVHTLGRRARAHIENARDELSKLLNIAPANIIFTSGATESLNTVLKNTPEDKVWISAIEHPAGREPVSDAQKIPVTSDGVVDLTALEKMLESDTPELISVMLVNNETGVIQPIKKIVDLAQAKGIKVHTDASQALGRIHIDMKELGVDYLSLSSHKFGGPQGVGALVLGPCVTNSPKLMYGGGQEKSRRAGTENVAGITGLGEAARLAKEDIDAFQKLSVFRDQIEDTFRKDFPGIKVWGQGAPRVANTICFTLKGVPASTMLMNLDMVGICVSSGSACSSGSVKGSTVLMAMGADEEEATCAIRFSMTWQTTQEDVDTFLDEWAKIYARIKHKVEAA